MTLSVSRRMSLMFWIRLSQKWCWALFSMRVTELLPLPAVPGTVVVPVVLAPAPAVAIWVVTETVPAVSRVMFT